MDGGSDQQHRRAFDRMQMRWTDQHPYPHSYHGTPAQEYPGFSWGSPPLPMHQAYSQSPPPHRPSHQQLQPLLVPQWPSMLGSQTAYYPTVLPPPQSGPTSSPPIFTPLSAASSTRSGSSGRRTLTDDERRRMCRYAEENPLAKQTEIGNLFGVERSTVSKVLGKREKYLSQTQANEGPRSPPTRRSKARVPDIEKALSAWVVRQQKKGSPISDDAIRDQACYFASVPGPENSGSNPTNTAGWLEKFKQKHNLPRSTSQSRKDSVADPENDSTMTLSPTGISPTTPDDTTLSPSPLLGRVAKTETPEDRKVFERKTPPLFSTMFTEMVSSSACFTPNVLSPTSPFFKTPDSTAAPVSGGPRDMQSTSPDAEPSHRGRSQTFPSLVHFMSSPTTSETMSPKFIMTNVESSPQNIDSPQKQQQQQQQQMLDSIDETMETETVDPTATLLPAPSIEARLAVALASHHSQTPTQDDAREALQVVLEFFETQPNGSLDWQEGVLLGRLVEKLQLKRRGSGDGE